MNKNCIDAEIVTGHYVGTKVFIPRIPLKPPENLNLPFVSMEIISNSFVFFLHYK